jgi:hypothetical protein
MDADGVEVAIDTDQAEALTLRWIVVEGVSGILCAGPV